MKREPQVERRGEPGWGARPGKRGRYRVEWVDRVHGGTRRWEFESALEAETRFLGNQLFTAMGRRLPWLEAAFSVYDERVRDLILKEYDERSWAEAVRLHGEGYFHRLGRV